MRFRDNALHASRQMILLATALLAFIWSAASPFACWRIITALLLSSAIFAGTLAQVFAGIEEHEVRKRLLENGDGGPLAEAQIVGGWTAATSWTLLIQSLVTLVALLDTVIYALCLKPH